MAGWVAPKTTSMELGEQLFAQGIAGALFHGAWRLVRAHQNRGHTVVIATSATADAGTADGPRVGYRPRLCTELETEHGCAHRRAEQDTRRGAKASSLR